MVASLEEAPRSDSARLSDGEFRKLRDFIRAHTGIALTDHKRALVCSRLGKRLRHHGLKRFGDYCALLLEHDPQGIELEEMINAITTNKTDFFREAHHFRFLEQHVFSQAREAAATGRAVRKLRLWSAGTSTGEEAYTLALVVRETFPGEEPWDVRILATDIDTRVLAHACEGIYTAEQAARIPPELLKRYFHRGQGRFEGYVRVKPVLGELVRFARLNLIDADWPFHGKFDAIFCRNVIIYFDRPTQDALLQHLLRHLRPDGYLFVGHSESFHGTALPLRHIGQSIYQYTGQTA
jgi:chemotaxis protein methyltransferase CheR